MIRRRNWGGWVDLGKLYPSVGLMTPIGNVIVKRWSDRLFSERHGQHIKCLKVFGLCISFVRFRRHLETVANLGDK